MWLLIKPLHPGALTFCCRRAISVGCFALNGYAMHRMTKTYNCSFFLRSSSSLCSLSRSSFSSLAADGLGLVGRALLRLLLGARPPELSLVLLGEMRDPAWGAIASLVSSSTIPSDSSSLDDGSNILLYRGCTPLDNLTFSRRFFWNYPPISGSDNVLSVRKFVIKYWDLGPSCTRWGMSAVRVELEEAQSASHWAFSACAEPSSMLTYFLCFIGQSLLRMWEGGGEKAAEGRGRGV